MPNMPEMPDKELKVREGMKNRYYATKLLKEKFIFLGLCSEEDRARIEGKKEMDTINYERISYIAETLGFNIFSFYLQNKYHEQFTQLAQKIEYAMQNETPIESEEVAELYDQWLQDFKDQLPTDNLKSFIGNIFAL